MVTSLDGEPRKQHTNQRAWKAHRFLQLERKGDVFHARTSADGRDWVNMPGSPLRRPDMRGLALQVGLCHAVYDSRKDGYCVFDNFKLELR